MNKKIALAGAAVAVLALMAASCASAEVIDKIAIVVNGEIITQGEIDRMLAPVFRQFKMAYRGEELLARLDEARQKIMAQLIQDKLILCEAKKLNVEVEEKEIDAKLDEIRKRFATAREFERALIEQRTTMKELRQRYKEQIMVRKMIDAKMSRVMIAPSDIVEYYNKHKAEFVSPAEVKLRNILVRPREDLPPDKALSLVRDIARRLREGGDFAELAKIYSSGPNAAEGGLMGWLRSEDLMPELERVVFSLKEGDVTGIIQTEMGYYIFKLEEKKESKSLDITEVRKFIEEALYNERVNEKLKGWIESLKKNAYIAFK